MSMIFPDIRWWMMGKDEDRRKGGKSDAVSPHIHFVIIFMNQVKFKEQ